MTKKILAISFTIIAFAAGIFLGIHLYKNYLASKQLVIASFGGSYQRSQRKAFFEPFEAATGIKIKEIVYKGTYPEIKKMLKKQKHIWDVIDLDGASLLIGEKEGVFEPIDFTIVNRKKFIPEAVRNHGIANIFYSNVIAYNTDKNPAGTPHPTTWTDFWNTEKFPGKRALNKHPITTLEMALLADGVKPQNLYPLNIDRALKSLNKIRDKIVWWETGQEPVNLLSKGKVAMSSAWNGRIWAAKKIDDKPLDIEWNQGLIDIEFWAVPKISKKKKLAMQFIEFATNADRQAEQTRYISYGPTNRKAIKYVDTQVAFELPTEPYNLQKQIVLNNQWWLANSDRVFEKWNEWLKEG